MRHELFVTAQGNGSLTPVVLSHALGLDHRMWDELATELARARPVLRYDHRGHGLSFKPQGPYTLDMLVQDAARVIEAWGRGPVVFVGLSMGGMVGQGLAITRPDLVSGLVLANTVAAYPPNAKVAWEARTKLVIEGGMGAVVDTVVRRYLHDRFRAAHPDVVRSLRDVLMSCDAAAYVASCAAVAAVDWLRHLPCIRCPTLVLAGALDQGATPLMAAEISDRIGSARLEVLAEASHLSVMEAPEEFRRLVMAHLEIC